MFGGASHLMLQLSELNKDNCPSCGRPSDCVALRHVAAAESSSLISSSLPLSRRILIVSASSAIMLILVCLDLASVATIVSDLDVPIMDLAM